MTTKKWPCLLLFDKRVSPPTVALRSFLSATFAEPKNNNSDNDNETATGPVALSLYECSLACLKLCGWVFAAVAGVTFAELKTTTTNNRKTTTTTTKQQPVQWPCKFMNVRAACLKLCGWGSCYCCCWSLGGTYVYPVLHM